MQKSPRRQTSFLTPQLGRLGLTAVIFFVVSGGAYGLEPLVGALGAGWAVVLILATPVLWCLPIALMSSELASAIPDEGGYYIWVRRALGEFWGFQEGWWTLCYTAVDMALYPALFVDYLGYFYPSLAYTGHGTASVMMGRWGVALAVIATGFFANWLGIRVVGKSSELSMALVLGPFAVITAIAFSRSGAWSSAFAAVTSGFSHGHSGHLLALGFATILWNYSGWDNVSTFAGEVKDARRSYPFALGAAQVLITAAYILPVLAGLSVTTSPSLWSESAGWPDIARLMAGPWLGIAAAAVALVSAWSMFSSQLLYISRLPYAMAREGWLPEVLTRLSGPAQVPTVTLAAACAVAGAFAIFPFTKLVVLDILLYAVEVFLEFIALMALRSNSPGMERPFRVPGGWPGLIAITVSPMALAAIVAAESLRGAHSGLAQLAVIPAMIVSGVILYKVMRARRQRTPSPASRLSV
ncbi:MAG: APC family permease [Acidobacteriota bacterium]|nr:APC family permease [Acidobacteriota bacterium]